LPLFQVHAPFNTININFNLGKWQKPTGNRQYIKLHLVLFSRINIHFFALFSDSENGCIALDENEDMVFEVGVILDVEGEMVELIFFHNKILLGV
jgi:hypothetical protein